MGTEGNKNLYQNVIYQSLGKQEEQL